MVKYSCGDLIDASVVCGTPERAELKGSITNLDTIKLK